MKHQKLVEAENVPKMPCPMELSSDETSAVRAAETVVLTQEVIDTVRQPLLVLQSGMQVQTANRAFCHMFGLSQVNVEQQCFYELDGGQWNVPEVRALLEHVWAQEPTAEDGAAEDLEFQRDFPRIGLRTMLLYARPLVRQGTHLRLILLAMEDITERRRAEERVQVYVQKLEWSNRELQDFAYIASHDLQEPLRAIQAFGERLHKQISEVIPEDARDSLDRLLRAAARMRGLVNDLLEFSRITTKAKPFTAVDLNEVVQQAQGDLSKRTEETGGRVDAEALPTLEADFTQMRQMMQNLIGNALKYGREGVPPIVTVRGEIVQGDGPRRTSRKRAMCRIEVQDNGIGFEEKHAQRIFAPFQRLHGRGKYDGTGIGLAICRKIVERHGGRITAQSVPGAGSLFTILLPVVQDSTERLSAESIT